MTGAPRVRTRGVMVMGTTSDAGKSFLATALCRILTDRGHLVQPFKAQNMSLNSIPAEEEGEIAVAQWLQCRAARVPATTLANPVLLKYEGPGQVEVIVRGRPRFLVRDWRREMPRRVAALRRAVDTAMEEVRAGGRTIVAEGAGSPVELNLRATDLANFHVAEALGLPVLLVASLDRGGALAQLVGTLELLEAPERRWVRGLVLNEMRGDASLLEGARAFLEDRTGIPVVGVVPHLEGKGFHWPAEDSLSLARQGGPPRPREEESRLGVVRFPHLSNFLDLEPLQGRASEGFVWVDSPSQVTSLDALLLPGTRRTVDDLAWMRETGLDTAIRRRVREGLRVAGFCGGYQVLGQALEDPHGLEGPKGTVPGLGLLPIRTRFKDPKIVRHVDVQPLPGNPFLPGSTSLSGYEIHRGRIEYLTRSRAIFRASPAQKTGTPKSKVPRGEPEGALALGGQIWGTTLHGLLHNPGAPEAFHRWAHPSGRGGASRERRPPAPGGVDDLERVIRRAARHVADHLDIDTILGWVESR